MGEKTDPDEGDVLDGENDPDEDIDVPDEGDDLDGGDDPLEGTDPIEGEEPEEGVVAPTTPGDMQIMGTTRETLGAPTIAVTVDGTALAADGSAPNRSANVKFTLTAPSGADDAELYYTVDGNEPTTSSTKYGTEAVAVTAPDSDEEATVTIKAIAHIPASGSADEGNLVEEQTSEAATFTVKFAAKVVEAKDLWPSIDNSKKAEWKLTPVSPLPSAAGKTYITVGTVGEGDSAWDAFLDASTNYTNTGIKSDALTGKILVFGAQPQDGYKFASTDTSKQVKATLIGQIWTNGTSDTDIREISAAYKNGHYEIDLGTAVQATDFTDYDGLKLVVWADTVQIRTATLTFPKDDKLTSVTDIKVNNAAATPNKFDSTTEGDWKISAESGSKISFKLTPAEQFTINKVTNSDTVLTPVSGVYTIASLDTDAAIDIEYGLNKTKTYGFSFAMENGSDAATANMSVSVNDIENTDDQDTKYGFDSITGTYTAGQSAQTLNDKIIATFTPVEDYAVTAVKVDGRAFAAKPGTDPALYEIPLLVGKVNKITVATKPIGAAEASTFAIENQSDSATVKVLVDGTAVTAGENGYAVGKGAEKVAIEITASRALSPTVTPVTIEDETETVGEVITNYTSKDSGKNTISTYTFLAKNIANKYIIDTETAYRNLTFKEASADGGDLSNVQVAINGKWDNDVAADYEIEYTRDTSLTIRVEAKDGATLNAVTVGGKRTAIKGKNFYEFATQLKEDVTVTVDAIGALVAQPLKEDETPLPPVKGVYNVAYHGTYTASVAQGTAKTPVTITAVQLLNGKTAVAKAEGKGDVVSIQDDTTAVINLDNASPTAISGKKLTLKLTAGGQDFNYTLQVSKYANTAAELTGLSKIQQLTDTTVSYDLKTKGDITKLTVNAEDAKSNGYLTDATINTTTGKLEITTGTKVAAKTDNVKITIGSLDSTATKPLEVITTPLVSSATKVEAKLNSATDIHMNLTLTDKKKTPAAAAGDLYYKIEATLATGVTSTKLENKTAYVRKTADVQDFTLSLRQDSTQLGEGEAKKFDVKVTLLHIKDKTEPTVDNESNVLVDGGSSAPFSKAFETQTPKYETKLSVKKGQATLYTGEQDVVIATATFNKVTTHRTLMHVEDITPAIDDAAKLKVELSDDTKVKASTKNDANNYASVGKHTIRIVAEADSNKAMAPSYCDMVVTVVQGINELNVAVPSDSLYKAPVKAATLKPTVIFNGDVTGKDKDKQPKTKKVVWSLVSESNDDPFWSDKVTINKSNGTVTVNKDYIVQTSGSGRSNTFRIKAVVDNGKNTIGDAMAAYSAPITITNEGLDLRELLITATNAEELSSTDSKGSIKNKVQASALDGAKIEVKDQYGSPIENKNLTFKSSNPKNVAVEPDENEPGTMRLYVYKPKTSAKITVTADDGSKAQLAISLEVDYDEPTGALALAVYPLEMNADPQYSNEFYEDFGGTAFYDPATNAPTGNNTSVSYAGGKTTTRLGVKVMQKQIASAGGRYEEAPWFVNYDLKVKSGGTKTSQDGIYNYLTTKDGITVLELTDKKTGAKSTYTLTNTAFNNFSSVTKKVTAKALNPLHQWAEHNTEQTVDIELEIPEEILTTLTGDDATAAAKVDLDWSKLTVKNQGALLHFRGLLKDDAPYEIEDYTEKGKTKHKITINFKNASELYFDLSAYDITVSVGSKKDGEFTQKAAAAAAKIKMEKTKTFTFKPATSYKIGPKDGSVALTGTANIPQDELRVSYTGVKNANINGNVNRFTEFFEVDETTGRLKLKADADISTFTANDKTGYLEYSAETDKTYYDWGAGTGDNLVKITVDLKATNVAAYTAGAASIVNTAGKTADVEILANKLPVRIAYATFDKTTGKTDACIDTTDGAKAALVSDGKIQLKLGTKAPKNKVKATVYVIPADSAYLSKFEDADNSASEQDYKDYGIAVTINLTVTAAPAITLAQAKDKVTEWVGKVTNSTITPTWLNADTTEADMKTNIVNDAKTAVGDNTVTVAINGETAEDWTFSAATTGATGTVSGKLKVTVGSESDTVEFSFTIPKKAALTPTVTGVTIKKGDTTITTDEVTVGTTAQYTAEVTGTNLGSDGQKVTWTLDGFSGNAGTTISATGLLTVHADETPNSTITVKATSQTDGSKSTTITVTVKAADGV